MKMLDCNNETSASISLLNNNFKRVFKTAFIDKFGQSLSQFFFLISKNAIPVSFYTPGHGLSLAISTIQRPRKVGLFMPHDQLHTPIRNDINGIFSDMLIL